MLDNLGTGIGSEFPAQPRLLPVTKMTLEFAWDLKPESRIARVSVDFLFLQAPVGCFQVQTFSLWPF